jgi:hypothetical protein
MTVRQLLEIISKDPDIDLDTEICLDNYNPDTDGIYFDYIKTKPLTDVVLADDVLVFQSSED